jgi:hypothetical protein
LAAEGMAILLISSDFEELLALSHRIVPISDGRTIGSVPASGINEEQLILLCAPRSSVERQNQLLKNVVSEFGVQAAWVLQAGDRILCLARQGDNYDKSLPEPGSVQAGSMTGIANALRGQQGAVAKEAAGHFSMLLAVENQRGHDLGCIAVTCGSSRHPLDAGRIKEGVAARLADFEEGQLRLRETLNHKTAASSQGIIK